ncbi:E3 ubiquitin-protein ligase TRIM22-like isoform X2 [Sturnira hondurensis]|uniref:E3 ubiquitin-protein ligase TRIM22-like isoform X2 n=1 Tax=Sturnira hondurensis TaxID=192404 RepID=UPI00187903F1|nr:E3 ubiquitin-protein ligase TRIM22-like isoform X2 [Sturnira hondurensis]
MDFSLQKNIDAVTCPICREVLKEPMSLDCGHNFCQDCITAESESGNLLELECRCPVCQIRYQPWNLRINWQLAERVKKLREVNMSSQQPRRRDLCEHHGENYDTFCKDDEKALCRLCVQEHQGHQMSPIMEVVKEYQEKIQEALKKLSQEQQEAEQLEADIKEERATWKNRMQTERKRILQGFEKMRGILDKEEQRELHKLEEDEVNDVINVLRRSEIDTLNKPKIVSNKTKSVFRVPDLAGMLQMFKELTEVQSYWVDLMLNPLNAVSNVVISADQRQVTVGQQSTFSDVHPCNPCDFSAFDVVGTQHFSSGKYYWEVDVSGKIAWILGVYSAPSNLNSKKSSGFVFNPSVNDSNAYSRFRPENGYWVIGLQNRSVYSAFQDSPTSDPKVLTLYMTVPPCRVGVFLDFEAGAVSFFNITNQGSLIYKFSNCHFSQTAYPYFNPWNCPVPMTLCPPGP